MFRKCFLLIIISVWGVIVFPLPKQADATTPLSVAVIQNLRNLVQLMPHNKFKRQARKSDSMSPGDKLSTGRSALADLRFNDGSLARIGEQAVFQFLPQKRNFNLNHGTVLLLIPPGRGQTRIRTPNAAAAIRGSALFVRYDQETDTTVVGALTNSGIQVSNKDASQKRELQAGQLIVLVKGELKGLYDFDLRTFYETSSLVRDLNLTLRNGIPNSDPAIASVQAETAAAVAAQSPVSGQDVVENPSFVKPTPSRNLPTNNTTRDNSPVDTILETRDVVPNAVSSSTSKPRTPTGSVTPPTDESTTITLPIVTPPPTNPVTVTQPTTTVPVVPPSTIPASTQPTVTAPVVTPPAVPVTQPTVTAPVVTPPSVPVTQPTVTAPVVTPPSVPVIQPTVTAPVVTPPSVPVIQPTVTAPVVTPPSVPVIQPTITTPSVPVLTQPTITTPSVPVLTQPTITTPSVPVLTQPTITTPQVTPSSVPVLTQPTITTPQVTPSSVPVLTQPTSTTPQVTPSSVPVLTQPTPTTPQVTPSSVPVLTQPTPTVPQPASPSPVPASTTSQPSQTPVKPST
jgi:hypothetical protein